MKIIEGELQAKGLKFCIVLSRFNEFITSRLLDGAKDALLRHGVKEEDIEVVRVPGSFEIPMIAKKMALKGTYNAIICLGTIIRGATPHFEYVAAEVSKGIATVSIIHQRVGWAELAKPNMQITAVGLYGVQPNLRRKQSVVGPTGICHIHGCARLTV